MAELVQKQCTNLSLKSSRHTEITQKCSSVIQSWNQSCCDHSSVVEGKSSLSFRQDKKVDGFKFLQCIWFEQLMFGLLILGPISILELILKPISSSKLWKRLPEKICKKYCMPSSEYNEVWCDSWELVHCFKEAAISCYKLSPMFLIAK